MPYFPPPTVPGGGAMAIGGAITGGTATRVLYEGAGPVLEDSAGFTYDGTNLAMRPDTDAGATLGRTLLDARGTDVAYFSHFDMTSTIQYAIRHSNVGQTRVNCSSGQTLTLNSGGTERLRVDNLGYSVFGVATSARSTGWTAFGNPAVVKTCDTATVTTQQLAQLLGTLVAELTLKGHLST